MGWSCCVLEGAVRPGWADPLSLHPGRTSLLGWTDHYRGGVSDGWALWAALAAGYDAAYMGTRFIATTESAAADGYKKALTAASLDDVFVSSALTGLATSVLRSPGDRTSGHRAGGWRDLRAAKFRPNR